MTIITEFHDLNDYYYRISWEFQHYFFKILSWNNGLSKSKLHVGTVNANGNILCFHHDPGNCIILYEKVYNRRHREWEMTIDFSPAYSRYTCRGLFERHKLLFSFHMCAKILEASGKINLDEYNFFLRGGVVSYVFLPHRWGYRTTGLM